MQQFLKHKKSNLQRLSQELLSETWTPSPYTTFTIHEPKERLISAAPFPDRVVHHAIMHVLEPLFERFSIHHSYACRKGKGLHRAIAYAVKNQRKHKYFLKLDIKKYFDSIDHRVLKELLEKRIDNASILKLLCTIIDSAQGGVGLPIGNLTSQHFANYYLGYMDHYIVDYLGCGAYLRYMDDFVLWDESKERLQEYKEKIADFCESGLSLELKPQAERLAPTSFALPLLGFRIFPNKMRLSPISERRFRQKYRKTVEQDNHDSVVSLIGFVQIASPKRYLQRQTALLYW